MEQKYLDFEDSIKRVHSLNFTPSFQENFNVKLKPRTFVEIATMVIEELDWELLYYDNKKVEANRIDEINRCTHKITAQINKAGQIRVQSESCTNGFWDFGSNSKRVKLFIYVFNEILKDYDNEKINILETEIVKKDNWVDYIVPQKLPIPEIYKKPNIIIPILGITISSLIISYLLALMTFDGLYIIGLAELGVGLILGYSFQFFMKLGNFTDLSKVKYLLAGAVILIFILNLYLQYQLILNVKSLKSIGFISFVSNRLEYGLEINNIKTGSIGLVLLWCCQIIMTYIISYVRVSIAIIKINIEKIPNEITEFAMYHLVKSKNKKIVRQHLSQIGWKDKSDQDLVFEAISAIYDKQEINRNL